MLDVVGKTDRCGGVRGQGASLAKLVERAA